MISTQPSVDDLLGRLQDEHERVSSLRRGLVHGVPRPPFLVRLLLLVCVVLIATVCGLIVVVGSRAIDVARAIREKRAAEAAAAVALPTGVDLLSPGIFRTALIRHPASAARLYAARGRELMAQKRFPEAIAAFAAAHDHAIEPLPAAALVDEIQALAAAGRQDAARERLSALDLGDCLPVDRQRAVGMLLELGGTSAPDPAAAQTDKSPDPGEKSAPKSE